MQHARIIPAVGPWRNRLLPLAVALALLPAAQGATGLEGAALAAAAAYSSLHGGDALLIRQEGRTLLSAGRVHEEHRIYSGTKAFWVMAAMCAVEDGLLRLDERAAETLPEWRGEGPRSRITIAQLLNFTSGLDPEFQLHENSAPDRDRTALGAPVVAAPGSAFIYGPASLQVFSEVLQRKLAPHETVTHYLERKVLHPLHLGAQRYLADKAGHPLLATGFLLTAEQWSRMGDLVLVGGQPVISAQRLQDCLRGTAANPGYGMAFWNNRGAAAHAPSREIEGNLSHKWPQQDWHGWCLCPSAPPDLVACVGSGFQRLYIVPSRALVVVRLGNGAHFSDAEFLALLFHSER